LSYKNSYGYWFKKTWDEHGNQLSCKDSEGISWEIQIK